MKLKKKHKVILGVAAALALLVAVAWGAFRPSVGSFDPSSPEALNDLTDVSTAGAANTNVLTYNGSSWDAQAAGGGGASLGNYASIVSSTYENTAGARMATGSIRIVTLPGDLSGENFTISNGTTSTLFTFDFGGNSFTPGHTKINSGGAPTQQQIMHRVLYAIALTPALGMIGQCDTYPTYENFGSVFYLCGTINEVGLMVTDTIRLVNPNAGTVGNVSITVNGTMLEIDGMSGGTN